jgi:hypothetical protein
MRRERQRITQPDEIIRQHNHTQNQVKVRAHKYEDAIHIILYSLHSGRVMVLDLFYIKRP